MNIARTLLDDCTDKRDVVLFFEEKAYTFGDMDNGICNIMEAIRKLAGPAGRVAILMGTSPEAIQAMYAVWTLGKTTVILSPLLGQEELKTLLERNRPELLLVNDETTHKFAFLNDLSSMTIYNVNSGIYEAPEGTSALDQMADCHEDDPAVILFTSGSTGIPKGVTLTHGSLYGSIDGVLRRIRGDRPRRPKVPGMTRKVTILPKPFFHISGLFNIHFTFEIGRSIHLMKKFNVDTFTKLVEETRSDSISVNPTMMKMLLDHRDIALPRLTSVKYLRSGTMPLPDKIRDEFERVFGITVLQGYGQTEACGEVIGWSASDLKFAQDKRSSIGRPHPNVELAIKDPQGNKLSTGEIGEICVRGKHFMKGYSDHETSSPFDDEGFLHTGDLGYIDEDGFVFLTGRLKNIIITGGFNIYPEEVENILIKYPGVREIGIASVPDERLGEIPIALIVLKDSEERFETDQFISFAREHLAHYKVPRKVYVIDSLPSTGLHKIDRPKLRELAERLVLEELSSKS